MNFLFTLSLEQRALANIAVTLWSQDDVKDLMSKSAFHILKFGKWQEIEKVVIQKSFELQLPEKLKEKLLSFIMRVGLQFLSWLDLHHCNYNFVTELPTTFVWTSVGTINNMKTAKLLVMGGTLDGDKSFALACMYCLLEEIKYCWNKFNVSYSRFKFKHVCFKSYWFSYMQKLHRNLLMPHSSDMFKPYITFLKEAVESGNEVAIRYFIKLNIEDEENYVEVLARFAALKLYNLKNFMLLHYYSDVMLFLLTKMNVKQQANIITNYMYALLKCLLVWPWHSLFLEMVKDKWNMLSKNEYSDLLYTMVDLMCYECNLHELFGEFWQQSPEAYKQFVTDQSNIVYLLIDLYKREDEKNVKLILKDSSISTRKNILKIGSKQIFVYLVSTEKWDSIRFLIQECLSSQENLIEFRDMIKKRVPEFWKEDSKFEFIKEYRWDKFFQLVDGYVFRYNKKKRRTEYNNTSSKKYLYNGW